MFTFKEASGNRMAYDLVRELPFRVRAIMRHFPSEIAEMCLEDVKSRAPKHIAGYASSLEVQQFNLPGISAASGIIASSKAYGHKVSENDPDTSVIYIEPKKVKGEFDAGATVLARYNPWTLDELPYEPDKKVANVLIRQVSEGEIRYTRLRLRSVSRQISDDLAEIGIRSQSGIRRMVGRKVTRDLTFEVLRAEFGIGPHHDAHWRPALRRVVTVHAPKTMDRMYRWLAVFSEKRWLRPVKGKVGKASTVRKVQRFQDIVYSSKGLGK